MGLGNTTTENEFFGTNLSIVGGKFTLRVEEGTDGAESRLLTKGKNEGKEVWELKYKTLEGKVISGILEENDMIGLQAIVMIIDDEGENYEIKIPAESRYLKEMIKRLPNVDSTSTVKIELVQHKTKRTKTGGPVFNLHVVQNGRVLSDHFTKWNNQKPTAINGMPEAVEGRAGWDFKAQDEFLFEQFDKFFANVNEQPAPEASSSPATPSAEPEDDYDDNPF